MKKNKVVTKSKKSHSKFFAIIFLSVSFVLCVSLADLFSSFIALATFQNNQMSNKVSAYSVYAISLNSSSVKVSVNEYVQTVQKSGGAGFVWTQNNVYYVLASCYADENDAELVKANLTNSSFNPEILKINFSEISIASSFSSKQQNLVNEALLFFKTTYKNLYDISISLDTSILTETEAKLEINTIQSKANNLISNFETLFENCMSNNLLILKLNLEDALEELNNVVNFSPSDNQSLSSKIKYSYIKILEINKKLCNSVSTI